MKFFPFPLKGLTELLTATLCLVTVDARSCLAESNKVQYELQARCGNQARDIYAKDWNSNEIANTKDGQIVTSFENHYNLTLNKCFYLFTATSYITKGAQPSSNLSLILLDVNDNSEIGEFYQSQNQDKPSWCYVSDTTCHSKGEWQSLIKPYMER
jgi:hypothetical protein